MAEREGRYRRGDDGDDDSLSPSSPSPSPPPVRRRRTPTREPRPDPRPEPRPDRLRDDDRYRASPRLPPERDGSRLDGSRLTKTRDRDPRESRHPRDDRDRDSPPPFQTKRQSITDRLRSSWNARKDELRGTPPPPPPNAAGNRPPSRLNSRRSSSAGQPPPGRPTPIAKVREWLDDCNAEHGEHCSGMPLVRPISPAHSDDSADESVLPPRGVEMPTWRPIWLIDAVERRLVRARADDRYLALSYVYERPPGPSPTGRNAPRETRRDNLGMLTENLDDASMPQAIADGIWLARKLGVKFLWVDRFCIVQDDDTEREDYLRNMGHVFANAYLTIVAAAGENADTGLSALVRPGGRAPPPVPKEALGPPGRRGHEEMKRTTRWVERCWTMVESFYSRRALFVFENTMTWECHCATWNMAGDVDGGPSAGPGGKLGGLQRVLSFRGANNPGGRQAGGHRKCTGRVHPAALGFRHAPWPDMDEYARICMEYASRRLTHAEDTVDAFRGFTHILAKTFAGGFVFGMPALFLDAALLWRPSATIRRRQLPPTMDSGGLNPVPSWSWMGWFFDGIAPDLTLWRAAADYILEAGAGQSNGKGGAPGDADGPRRRFRSTAGFRLRTTCQFHVTDRATTAPIRNDGMRFRNARHQSRKGGPPLPPGWAKSNSSGGFRHDSDGAALFRYPVPMAADIPTSELPVGGELIYPGTLLSFNTTRAMLSVDFAAPFPAAGARRARGIGGPKDAEEGGIPLAIGNIIAPRSGKYIGTLRSHDAWLGLQGSNYEGEERLELIAVSEGSERVLAGDGGRGPSAPSGGVISDVWGPGCDLEAVKAHADADGILDFVNVLWVERVGGVCFRRGVGHVFVQAWEAFARERVDLLLG